MEALHRSPTSGQPDDGVSAFVQARSRMLAVAVRTLGNAAEAEDIVQDVWLRWQNVDRDGVRNAPAFLTTTTIRLAINRATGARTRHETALEFERGEPADPQATIFHPDDAEPVGNVLGRCLRTGEHFSMRYRLRRADGSFRWMSGRAEPMRDEGGRIIQWFGLCHDIDDQIHAEDALRRASDQLAQATRAASLAELSASIAHEVNQPLAAIVAHSHACQRWLSVKPPHIERAMMAAERITRDANSAADVVSRIRALFQQAPHPGRPRTSTV
jgi:DNA-directed RNA polymerase specialized sigma24 family protein